MYSLCKNKHSAINRSLAKPVPAEEYRALQQSALFACFRNVNLPLSHPPSLSGSQLLGEENNSFDSVCSSYPCPLALGRAEVFFDTLHDTLPDSILGEMASLRDAVKPKSPVVLLSLNCRKCEQFHVL